jgi:hypothetical protein
MLKTLWNCLVVSLIVLAVGNMGCGGFTLQLGGGGSYHDDGFYYDHGGYSYYDSYWYYDDYWYDSDDYYFVDYVDGWYYDWYDGCYYCKASDLDTTSLEEPVSWKIEWGSWERFVKARLGFLQVNRSPGKPSQKVPVGE